PRNSCLNDVLERRLGIPITLSVLAIEVGRRVGLEIVGIGLPGHFCVGSRVGDELLVLDPFGGGRLVERGAAEAIVTRSVGRRRVQGRAAAGAPDAGRAELMGATSMARGPQRVAYRSVAWLIIVAFLSSSCASRSVPPMGADGKPFKPESDELRLWAQAEKE